VPEKGAGLDLGRLGFRESRFRHLDGFLRALIGLSLPFARHHIVYMFAENLSQEPGGVSKEYMNHALYFLKASSGYIKIGRSSNFDKRLSEIRRGTTDSHVEVLAVCYADAETIAALERELHQLLESDCYRGNGFTTLRMSAPV
jgi:hypothetical protein